MASSWFSLYSTTLCEKFTFLYDKRLVHIVTCIFIIKPTRCTNFWNLFLELNSTCFGHIPAWNIPLLCLQWKTPDDGQRNCPKHVEFYSKNKFEKLVHLVGFIIRIVHDARSPERHITYLCCNWLHYTFCILVSTCFRRVVPFFVKVFILCVYMVSFWPSHKATGLLFLQYTVIEIYVYPSE